MEAEYHPSPQVKLAVCTHLTPAGESVADIAAACGATGIDFALTHDNIDNLGSAVADCCGPGNQREVRYHAYFADVEIGSPDSAQAERGLEFMCHVVDRVAAEDGRYLTIHLGFNPGYHGAIDIANAINGLKGLIAHAEGQGVTVCVENLRTGLTSEPEDFISLVEESGASVTFDVGHFNSSAAGSNGYSAADIIGRLGDRIVAAHVYEAEIDGRGHIAPPDLSKIKPALDALSKTSCGWWVAELGDPSDVCRTVGLLREYRTESVS